MTVVATQPVDLATITVNEQNVVLITGTLRDQAGDPVPAAALQTLTLTLYDKATDTLIRDHESVFNVNGGTFHPTSGAFALTLSAADNAIVTATLSPASMEQHLGVLEATWGGGTGYWSGLLRLYVRQIHHVP